MRLLFVFMLISFFAVAQQGEQKLAYQYYVNGEYDKAISIYEELNKERFSVAYYIPYFGSLLKTEQYKQAEKLAKKVVKIYPNSLNYQLRSWYSSARKAETLKRQIVLLKKYSKI